MSVAVVGSFMYDLMVDTPRQPRIGETLRGISFRQSVGGKGFNQAMAAAATNADAIMVGRLGDDSFGAEFRSAMHAAAIDDSHVKVSTTPGSGTGVGMPSVFPDGNNAIIIIPRANLEVSVEDVDDAAREITSADVLLLQLEIPVDSVVRAAEIAHEAGTKVILNPAPQRDLPPKTWEFVDLFVPNEGELLAFAESMGILGGSEDILDVAQRFADQVSVVVIVTLGDNGAAICDPNGTPRHVSGYRVKAVDSVGAGDTFCGALSAALSARMEIDEAIDFANAAAALSVTKRGSGTSAPAKTDVIQFMNDHTGAGARGGASC